MAKSFASSRAIKAMSTVCMLMSRRVLSFLDPTTAQSSNGHCVTACAPPPARHYGGAPLYYSRNGVRRALLVQRLPRRDRVPMGPPLQGVCHDLPRPLQGHLRHHAPRPQALHLLRRRCSPRLRLRVPQGKACAHHHLPPGVNCLEILPNGLLCVGVSSNTNNVIIYDLECGCVRAVLDGPTDNVFAMMVAPAAYGRTQGPSLVWPQCNLGVYSRALATAVGGVGGLGRGDGDGAGTGAGAGGVGALGMG